MTQVFQHTCTAVTCFLRFEIIIGFIGMLRPHIFPQLLPSSFPLMVRDGYCLVVTRPINATKTMMPHALNLHQDCFGNIGFQIDFKAKTRGEARAYFPHLPDANTYYSQMCPVEALRKLFRKDCLSKRKFKKGFKVGPELAACSRLLCVVSSFLSVCCELVAEHGI